MNKIFSHAPWRMLITAFVVPLRSPASSLGEAVAPFRDQVVLATKFGWKNGDPKADELDGGLERIRLVAEQSL